MDKIKVEKINTLLQEAQQIAMDSGGVAVTLKKAIAKDREAFELARELVNQYPDDILAWHLKFGTMEQSGVWEDKDGDIEKEVLQVIDNLIRLNPEDDDELYKGSFYEPNYSADGGLYYFKFQVLTDLYYFGQTEEGWPNSEHGRIAKETIKKAIELHPSDKDFLIEEAEAVDIILE